eukprot:4000321-Amphidinium_carterae.1
MNEEHDSVRVGYHNKSTQPVPGSQLTMNEGFVWGPRPCEDWHHSQERAMRLTQELTDMFALFPTLQKVQGVLLSHGTPLASKMQIAALCRRVFAREMRNSLETQNLENISNAKVNAIDAEVYTAIGRFVSTSMNHAEMRAQLARLP